jgi:cytochrome d ubiquinol oxidase subunit II
MKSWIVVATLAAAALALARTGAPEIYRGLTGTGIGRAAAVLTFVVLMGSGWSLLRRRDKLSRLLAVMAAVAMLWGWALSQFPFLVEPSVTIHDAAPQATLQMLFLSLLGGSVLLFPFLWYLYRLFKPHAL